MSRHNSDSENIPSGDAIYIQNLMKVYPSNQGDVKAVNGLNLQIRKGELYGLLGPNGAGKSTTINILCGLSSATSGQVFVNGHNDSLHRRSRISV